MPYASDVQRKAIWAKKSLNLRLAEKKEKKMAKEASYYGIEKLAATFKLQEQQKRVLDKLDSEDALLVYHDFGSGKSLTGLAAGDKFNKPVTIIGPAALRHNFPKEKAKHGIQSKINIYTYNKPPTGPNGVLLFDEAHKMGRLESKRSHYPDVIKGDKTLFMTGTPIRNHPSELIPIMRGLNVDIDRSKKGFEEEFIETIKKNPNILSRIFLGVKPGVEYDIKNVDKLKNMLKGKVDYHAPSIENYPSVVEKDIIVSMTPRQNTAYNMVMKGRPDLAYKVRHGLAPSKTEASQLNAFLMAARQVSNIPVEYNMSSTIDDAPKMHRAVSEIKKRINSDPNYKGVTYSNFLKSGIEPMSELLKDVPHILFTGKQTDKQRFEAIKAYNSGKVKQLLISGAGAEDLDLKGTKLLQILEPYWNEPLLDQVRGRVARYKSHSHLPENERKVEIQNYLSIPLESGLIFKTQDTGSDEYLRRLAARKNELNQKFLKVLQIV